MMDGSRETLRQRMRDELAAELRKHGRSQTALAKFLGLDQSAISRMVNGRREIKANEWEAIKLWLEETDPSTKSRREEELAALPRAALSPDGQSPLTSYPEVYEQIARRNMLGRSASDGPPPTHDYPVVMMQAAGLETALAQATAELIEDGLAPAGLEAWPAWGRIEEKIAALVAAGRMPRSIADRVYATLALRDAFAHSGEELSLAAQAVRPIVARVMNQPPEEVELMAQEPQYFRLLFAFCVSGMAFMSGVKDREKALALWDALVMKRSRSDM